MYTLTAILFTGWIQFFQKHYIQYGAPSFWVLTSQKWVGYQVEEDYRRNVSYFIHWIVLKVAAIEKYLLFYAGLLVG